MAHNDNELSGVQKGAILLITLGPERSATIFKHLKEEEIEHSALTPAEKDEQKRLWKQWIDETTKGFKEVLKKEGRMK